MSPQQRSDGWSAGIIVTILLAAFGLSSQIGRYQERVDRLLSDQAVQQHTDAGQDGRLGVIENRTTALETDMHAIKEGRYDEPTRRPVPRLVPDGVSVQ